MDSAANNLKKTSIIEQEAMVSKLHNMQWLKNTSYSPNHEKTKVIHKQRQDCGENGKIEDTVSSVENCKANLVEESNDCCLKLDTCAKDFSNTMSKSNENICNKDIATANMFPSDLVNQKIEEEEEMLNLAVVESLVTAKLEAQYRVDEERKYQANVLQDNIEQNTQDNTCSNSNTQEFDKDTDELNVIKYSDGNNNHSKLATLHILEMNAKKTICELTDEENDKASVEAKDKDVKMTTSTPKLNIKNENNTNLSKNNEKSFTPTDPKKSVSNLSKSLTVSDKNGKVNRFNNKHVFTRRNSCTKEQESAKQSSVSKNGGENKIKDTTAKSSTLKIDFGTPSKIVDLNRSDRRIQSICNISSNKYKASPNQQQTAKPKGQESFKKNASTFNRTTDKNKVSDKMEKITNVSKTSDFSLDKSEKKNEKIAVEKDIQNGQGVNRVGSFQRNTTFVTQYKNSTFSKSVQTKGTSGSSAYIPRRNSLYTQNNSISDRDRAGKSTFSEHKDMKTKRECTSTDMFPKSNIETQELRADNLENPESHQQSKIEHMGPTDTKTMSVQEKDISIPKDSSIDPVKIEAHPVEKKEESAIVNYTEQKFVIPEQCYENKKAADDSKTCIKQQPIEMSNEEMHQSKLSSNLYSDNHIAGLQVNSINQHLFKLENTQRTADINQLGNNQAVWNNDPSNTVAQKGVTIASTQQFTQNVHSQQIILQAGNQTRQTLPQEINGSKFYSNNLPINDTIRLPQIPNTFDVASYECNAQAVPNNVTTASMFEATADGNIENAHALPKYTSNLQQRPITAFSEFHSAPGQVNRWTPSMQDAFYDEQFVNTTQPATMHIYNPGTFGSGDFNNTHAPNCLPPHSVFYTSSSTPSCIQPWNPQLQYPVPVFHNSPCTNYTVFPNMANQSNFSDVAVNSVPVCMRDQQHKYVHCVQMNNNLANTGQMQMHANPNYVRGTHGDPGNCAVEMRNTVDNTPIRPNRYYKRYQDNCRGIYNVPQYSTSISHLRPQQPTVPLTGANQYNLYCPPNLRYHKQNAVNYVPISRSSKGQKTQDFVCEDNGLEDIPPIISPKEIMTNNVNLSNKTDQFATRALKPDYKMRSNVGYRQPPLQRYNNNFRRHSSLSGHDFSRECTSTISVGRGISKTKRE